MKDPICPIHGNNRCLLNADAFAFSHLTPEEKTLVLVVEEAIAGFIRAQQEKYIAELKAKEVAALAKRLAKREKP